MRSPSDRDKAEAKRKPDSAPDQPAFADGEFPKMLEDKSNLKRIPYAGDVEDFSTDELYCDLGVGD